MDKLYTIIEVANKLNLSDKTLRRWEEAGRFTPSRTLGNQRRYSLEDLQILDAIKHGTINEQKDLLTVDQAAKLCGVSPTTIVRWEESGKIHPLITSGNTYYPRQRLIEKLDELKKIYVEPAPYTPGVKTPLGSDLKGSAQPQDIQSAEGQTLQEQHERTVPHGIYLTNALITLLLIFSYHLIFNSPTKLISPQTGTIQNVYTANDPTFDLLKTIMDPSGALTTTTLTSKIGLISPTLSLTPSSAPANPSPGVVYYDAVAQSLKIFKVTGWADLAPTTNLKVGDVTLVTSSTTLSKGKSQVSVTHDKIIPTTTITATFTSDYAPAKKYWITTEEGAFTLHTDFPVGADSTFNYNFVTPTSTTSAIIKP